MLPSVISECVISVFNAKEEGFVFVQGYCITGEI